METCQLYTYNSDEYSLVQGNETFFSEQFKTSELLDNNVYWLNYHSLKNQEEIKRLFDAQNFDRLVLEDVYARMRRPKLEEYDEYFFFSLRSVLPPKVIGGALESEQLSFILGKNFLVSLQEKNSDFFSEVRTRIEARKGKIRDKGADYLLFRLLDAIIDNYYRVVEHVAERNKLLESKIIDNQDSSVLKTVELQKQRLQTLRSIIQPLKEITLQLEKSNSTLLSKDNLHYFMDLKEGCLNILDDIDYNLMLLDGLTNLYYAAQGQKMNEIMRTLTVVSAVFIPLTFLAGIYGMNFNNMPELHAKNGYFILLGVMFILAVALIVYFYRKGWLGRKG